MSCSTSEEAPEIIYAGRSTIVMDKYYTIVCGLDTKLHGGRALAEVQGAARGSGIPQKEQDLPSIYVLLHYTFHCSS